MVQALNDKSPPAHGWEKAKHRRDNHWSQATSGNARDDDVNVTLDPPNERPRNLRK